MASHPDFERYKLLFQAGRHEDALAILDSLFGMFPQSVSLHWHRALCLEKLERLDEMATALAAFLDKQPDYAPAILKRIEYTWVFLDAQAPYPEDPDEEGVAAEERAARQRGAELRERLEREWAARDERDLRRMLAKDPEQAEVLYRLSGLLRVRNDEVPDPATAAEASGLLEKAIRLAPDTVEYRLARADQRRGEALVIGDDVDSGLAADDPNIVKTMMGMRFRRDRLEDAAEDYAFCWQRSGEIRPAMQLATILHDLGRYDAAMQCCDEVLAKIPPDDPRREMILNRRARSENDGAGEREEIARMLEAGIEETPGRDRTAEEQIAAQALLGAADAIRKGSTVSDAVAGNVSDDPETMMAMNIARQLLGVANEPPPRLEAVDPAGYPAFQRKHCDAVERAASRLGLQKIADAEARGLFNMLGSHVLLRIFSNAEGDVGLASFAMKPRRPGWIAFLLLLLLGKWKVQTMIECVTQFDDGSLITTQPDNISPFEYGGKITMIKLPKGSGVDEILRAHVEAVATFRAANPGVQPMIVKNLAAVEERWVAGQKTKLAYRRSIGYVSDNELRRLLGTHYDRYASKVRAQLGAMAGA